MSKIYLVSAKRSAIGSMLGTLSTTSPTELGAKVLKATLRAVRKRRLELGCVATFCRVPVSGVAGNEDYYYSTYSGAADEVPVSDKKKIMILGGGPNRIGQGIEFDYTCVHAAFALRDAYSKPRIH